MTYVDYFVATHVQARVYIYVCQLVNSPSRLVACTSFEHSLYLVCTSHKW